MQLKEVMTRNLEGIPPQAMLTAAAEKMRALDVGALPVYEHDKIIGILTDRDIAVRAVATGRDPRQTPARDAMTPGIVYCYEDEDVLEAVRRMEQKQIRRLLVFDRHNEAVGIVSLGDIATRIGRDRLSGNILERISEPSQPHA
jgi:CBS domain-containing protein